MLRRVAAALVLPLTASFALAVGLTAAQPSSARPASPVAGNSGPDLVRTAHGTYVVDPVRPGPAHPTAWRRTGAAPSLKDALTLHSKPGSKHVIFIDFDGATVSGTDWNKQGLASGFYGGWGLDGDDSSLNADERAFIEQVWQIVAEDYAPFDIDVTTQDPGEAAITRSGAGDDTYGARALVTDSQSAEAAVCGGCAGVAFLGVFDTTSNHAQQQPTWIFAQSQSSMTPKPIAETVSHEVGHNLGLSHDGNPSDGEYYYGHGIWAPIMGFSDFVPVTQWSNGAYTGATNHEDDITVISQHGAPLRTDEAGGSVTKAASAPPSGTAFITTRSDVDVYALPACQGPVSVDADPAAVAPDLDIRLRLLNASGSVVDSDDPPAAMNGSDPLTATGMAASVGTTSDGSALFAEVDGVGNGTPDHDYDDYASVGSYTLDVRCDGSTPGPVAPGAVRDLSLSSPAADSLTATWTAPLSDGRSPITSYSVSIDQQAPRSIPASTTSTTFTGLAAGSTHTVTVAAVNAVGTGPASSLSGSTGSASTAPDAPTLTKAAFKNQLLSLRWSAPGDPGSSAVQGYVVSLFKKSAGGLSEVVSSEPVQGTKARFNLRGVSRKARYVAVYAFNEDFSSDYSNVRRFR